MSTEKENLNFENRRQFVFRMAVNGVNSIGRNRKANMKLIAGIVLMIVMFELWAVASPDYIKGFVRCSEIAIAPLIILSIFIWIGSVKGSWEIYKNLVRIGFVNSAGEAPLLIGRKAKGDQTELTFISKGITAEKWNERIEEIQSALNLTVGRIRQSNDYRTVSVVVVPPNMTFGSTIMWGPEYVNLEDESDYMLGKTAAGEIVHWDINKMPHCLIGGATSSGKTRLAMVILMQAILRDAYVNIIDLKGLDYYALARRDARIVTDVDGAIELLDDTVALLYKRIEKLQKVHAANFTEYCDLMDKMGKTKPHRIFVLIDECSMLTNSGIRKEDKKKSEDCVDKMATIVRIGRAVGIHLIVSTQVPDVNSVPTAIRANLDLRICGKADSILSTMILGDGRANETIPKDSKGRFMLSNGAEDIVFQAVYFDE